MNALENCLVLLSLPLALLLAGYGLAARLTKVTSAERAAVAVLAGLVLLLWNVSAIGFFQGLNGFWAWACLWPIAATLIDPKARTACAADVGALVSHRRGWMAVGLTSAFLLVLLWPLLTRSELVFYDGTSSHDAFFWIAAAEHLKRHSYMELPVTSLTRPLMYATPAIVGWKPLWGRMGAEGLLALVSSILGVAPVKLYLAATATLVVPWISAVYLVVRTFHLGRLRLITVAALVVLQPVFVFFFGNENLPNLLGALATAAAVVALERALRSTADRWAWLVLLALSLHGVLCAYPEMLPFVALPAGLLWWRFCLVTGWRSAWRPAAFGLLATLAGALVNPASTIRGLGGFVVSFDTARANANWANLFAPLSATEYLPALATLAVPACNRLGPLLGAAGSLALIAGLVLALRRSLDRTGALVSLAGAGALLAYTFATGFSYGWQKTVQFGGAFWVALVPLAMIDAFTQASPTGPRRRWLARAGLATVLLLFGYATLANCLDGYKWARQKIITSDWFALHDYARTHLGAAPVLVEGASFRMAFFHSMWATYFLRDNDLYFGARGQENGGYVREGVINEARGPLPGIGAYLVGRDWADAFDQNSPRLLQGDTFVLLGKANRVVGSDGLSPENGRPENAAARFKLSVTPHSPSALQLTLAPRYRKNAGAVWRMTRQVDGLPPLELRVATAPPWRIEVPLEPGKINALEFIAEPTPASDRLPPFVVSEIKITAAPK